VVEWIESHFWELTGAGIAMSLAGLAMLVVLAVKMPADHFTRPHNLWDKSSHHPAMRLALRLTRNLLGAFVLVLGIVMALPGVPGPGLLFIVLGVSLMDIPGKHAAIHYIISKPLVLNPINRLRARWNRPPLEVPPRHGDTDKPT
jgi:hypothetical protein